MFRVDMEIFSNRRNYKLVIRTFQFQGRDLKIAYIRDKNIKNILE